MHVEAHGVMRSFRLVAAAAALTAAAAVAPTAVASPGSDGGPTKLVALGDSYASGPLIPVQTEQPWGCLRSSNNYAHQLARTLDLDLTDVTCSGAQTEDMWETQGVSPEEELGSGGNPPQLEALTADTDIVTLQIGGNDIGFSNLAFTCGEGALREAGGQDTSCTSAVEAKDPFGAIADTAPLIVEVLEGIHARSPDASIYVLGYPGIFKIGETARCDAMGVGEDDARYLRSIHEALNAMIREVAERDGQTYSDVTTYVDVYGPSAGHTACDLPVIRWVEPIVPVNAAAPVHPNLGGMTAVAELLADAVWPADVPRRSAPPISLGI